MIGRFGYLLPVLLAEITVALLPSVGRVMADEVVVPATGRVDERLAPFDNLMIEFLRERPAVPGASLAVARHGKLVYQRGFGYADRARQTPVQPDSQFRIASISKPLTAVAVLQLVERGKLALTDRVFDVLKLTAPQDVPLDERWRTITIHQLLQHRGGWDRSESFDPMFVNRDICATFQIGSPAMQSDIIRYMLRHKLDFDPGLRYAYSNFGFCLLGRVIEKVSGQPYEAFVRENVLRPVGADHTQLGRTLFENRLPGEVYYDAGDKTGTAILGPNLGSRCLLPYGTWCHEALDSHGGWVATAADLVRFAAAFDEPEHCKLLTAAGIETMLALPEGAAGHESDGNAKKVYYGCGWQVRTVRGNKHNQWHVGSLPGTSTLMVHRSDNLVWAVLFNSRGDKKNAAPAGEIDPLLHKAAAAVRQWPD